MPISTGIQLPPFHPFLNADIPWLLRRAATAHAQRQFMVWEPFEGEPQRWTYEEAYRDIRQIAPGLF